MADQPESFEASRVDKLRRIEALGVDPWGQRFDGHQPIAAIRALPADKTETERPRVKAAGRIIQRRGQGKAYFVDVWDWTGKVQVMIGQKQVGEVGWEVAQNLDLGDLIGVEGHFGKTKMGEPTIFIDQRLHPDDRLTFLGKSLQPHPDKWGGMQDMEFRLRHRYLDLIYNPEMLGRALKRVQIIRRIRSYLEEKGYCEVETPTLHAIAGGAAARPFITHHNALDIDLYLRIALELHLKRLLVGGIEKVYEIGRVFRNEGIDARHNPEFTMLELYQAYGNYETMMELTEGLIVACVECLGAGMVLPFGETTIDFSPPWQRKRYADLFLEHVGVAIDDEDGVRSQALANRIPLEVKGATTPVVNASGSSNASGAAVNVPKDHDVLVHELFEHKVEDKLTGPIFVYDYPAKLCPLTKRKNGQPNIAERFELYVSGMELANAYTELNDPVTQEATFRQQLAGLPEEDSMAKMDEDFVRALRHGMPPAGGLGIGIDRLVMLLTNTQTIRDVILFPLLRSEK